MSPNMAKDGCSMGALLAAAALAVTLANAPATAGSGEGFNAPEGCTGYLTVQQQSCRMSNHWTCDADAPGERWRVDIGPNGPTFLSKIDAETQWIESYDLFPTRKQTLIQPAVDPASFTELVELGLDTYDFRIAKEVGEEHVVGFDRIVDREVKIDGEPLMQTQFEIRVTEGNGTLIWQAKGFEYISLKHRQFFAGHGEFRNDAGSGPYDYSPVEFIYSGEPGFFADRPKYGCDATDTSYRAEAD